jgi:hypothetical protein
MSYIERQHDAYDTTSHKQGGRHLHKYAMQVSLCHDTYMTLTQIRPSYLSFHNYLSSHFIMTFVDSF